MRFSKFASLVDVFEPDGFIDASPATLPSKMTDWFRLRCARKWLTGSSRMGGRKKKSDSRCLKISSRGHYNTRTFFSLAPPKTNPRRNAGPEKSRTASPCRTVPCRTAQRRTSCSERAAARGRQRACAGGASLESHEILHPGVAERTRRLPPQPIVATSGVEPMHTW